MEAGTAMRFAAIVCGVVLLVGVPLIWHNWPPLPAPEWDEYATFSQDADYEIHATDRIVAVTLPGSSIDGVSTIVIPPGARCKIWADGQTYHAMCEGAPSEPKEQSK